MTASDPARVASPGDRTVVRTARSPAAALVAVAAVPVGLAVAAVVRWCWALITNAGRGLDVSDEAYYLISIAHPADTTATNTDFGFYWHRLLWLVGGRLSSLRIAGLIVLLVTCALAAAAAVGVGPAGGSPSRRGRVAALGAGSALVAATALVYYGTWLPTPSYNLLNLVLLLLVAACLITGAQALARGRVPLTLRAGAGIIRLWPFAALGALLTIGATVKLTSHLAAAAVGGACLTVVAGRRIVVVVGAALAGAGIGLVVHWGLFAGSPVADVRRMVRSGQAWGRLGSHPADRVWQPDFLAGTVAPWLGAVALAVVVLAVGRRFVPSPAVRTGVFLALAAVAFVVMGKARPHGGPLWVSNDTGWWWLRTATLALVGTTALAPRRDRLLAVGPAVALLALAATAGTSNGLVRQLGVSAGLLGLGVLVQAALVGAMTERWPRRALATAPAALFFVLAAVTSIGVARDARADPYRLVGPLTTSTERVELGPFGAVRVAPGTAAYVEGLQALAGELTETQRRCLVDLTGGTPLASLALGARPAGATWLLGGYRGSAAAADYWLSLDDCTRGPIALLEAPDGRRSIPRPAWLADRELRPVGRVEFHGYLDETQVLFVAD